MSAKMKPNEVRNLLLNNGNVRASTETLFMPRAKDPKASMQNAIAARKAMFKQAPKERANE